MTAIDPVCGMPVPGTTRKLLALSLSIALAMSGVGIILPVVPSHIGRLGLAGASTEQVALHVSLLAVGYALMQLLLAPRWGRLSDSLGRRPLLAIGLIGFAVGQALCGLATSLLRRGGAYAGAALGLESSAKSLGQIAGPVLGGVLFGASVAVPFWLASGLLLGLAPIFAWSGRARTNLQGGRKAKGKLAFRRQETR